MLNRSNGRHNGLSELKLFSCSLVTDYMHVIYFLIAQYKEITVNKKQEKLQMKRRGLVSEPHYQIGLTQQENKQRIKCNKKLNLNN